MKLTKVPIVGAGGGEGVFVHKKTNQRTYFLRSAGLISVADGVHVLIKC